MCGTTFLVKHALSCPTGVPTIRHNEARDSFACWALRASLQNLTSEKLNGATAIGGDGARLDIVADGLWGGRKERSYFDMRVINPHACSNHNENLNLMYRRDKNMKKRHSIGVREVEQAYFVPLVLSATRLGISAKSCLKRLTSLLATKRDQPYSQTKPNHWTIFFRPAKKLHSLH